MMIYDLSNLEFGKALRSLFKDPVTYVQLDHQGALLSCYVYSEKSIMQLQVLLLLLLSYGLSTS